MKTPHFIAAGGDNRFEAKGLSMPMGHVTSAIVYCSVTLLFLNEPRFGFNELASEWRRI